MSLILPDDFDTAIAIRRYVEANIDHGVNILGGRYFHVLRDIEYLSSPAEIKEAQDQIAEAIAMDLGREPVRKSLEREDLGNIGKLLPFAHMRTLLDMEKAGNYEMIHSSDDVDVFAGNVASYLKRDVIRPIVEKYKEVIERSRMAFQLGYASNMEGVPARKKDIEVLWEYIKESSAEEPAGEYAEIELPEALHAYVCDATTITLNDYLDGLKSRISNIPAILIGEGYISDIRKSLIGRGSTEGDVVNSIREWSAPMIPYSVVLCGLREAVRHALGSWYDIRPGCTVGTWYIRGQLQLYSEEDAVRAFMDQHAHEFPGIWKDAAQARWGYQDEQMSNLLKLLGVMIQ